MVGVVKPLDLLVSRLELLVQLGIFLLELSLHVSELLCLCFEPIGPFIRLPDFKGPCLLLLSEVLARLKVHVWVSVLIQSV